MRHSAGMQGLPARLHVCLFVLNAALWAGFGPNTAAASQPPERVEDPNDTAVATEPEPVPEPEPSDGEAPPTSGPDGVGPPTGDPTVATEPVVEDPAPPPRPDAPVALPVNTGRTDPTPDLTRGAGDSEPAPRHRLIYSNALLLRLNPLGLDNRFSLVYRRRLSARTGKLWDDTYFGVGFTPTFSPSISRVGPTMMLVPLAILQLRASYYFIGYYGSQGFKAHDFVSPNDQFGPDTIKGRADANQAINTFGGQAEIAALLQVKFGPVAVLNEVIFYNNQIKLPGDSDVFYDLRHDIMAPGKGWFLSNDSSLLYVNTKLRFNAGVRATYYHMFYPDGVYQPGDVRDTNLNDHARIGPLLSYTFRDRPEKRFTKPTIFVLAQWWVKHRYRTGQEVHQAFPNIVMGFSFTGELWRKH